MVVDFGYGIDMSRAKLKQGAAKYVFEHYATDDIRSEFEDFCADNQDLVEDGTAEEVFVEEYEDSLSCANGIEVFIVRCINDIEFYKRDEFIYDDYCIYVGARIPEDDSDRQRMLTKADIHRILAKYLNPILETEVVVEHLEINN